MVNYEYFDTRIKEIPDLFWCSSNLNYEKVPFDNKFILPIPIDKEAFPFELKSKKIEKILCQCGTDGLYGYNGTDKIIEAIESLHEKYPNVTLEIHVPDILSVGSISPKSDKSYIKIVTTSFPFPSGEQYRDADLFISIQSFRATSLPIEEAIACGIPVLTTNISPFDELIGDKRLLIKTSGYIDTPILDEEKNIWGFNICRSFNQRVRFHEIDVSDLCIKLENLLSMNSQDIERISLRMKNIMETYLSYDVVLPQLIFKLTKIIDKHLALPGITMPYFPYYKKPMNLLEKRIFDYSSRFKFALGVRNVCNILNDDHLYLVLKCNHCSCHNFLQQIYIYVDEEEIPINIKYNKHYFFIKLETVKETYDIEIKSVLKFKLYSASLLIIPKRYSKNVIYLGNFRTTFSTENHVARDFETLGYNIIRLQEDYIDAKFISDLVEFLDDQVYLVLYTRTWIIKGNLAKVWKNLEDKMIATASYHLDLYYPLDRKESIVDDPFWKTKYVFITDFNPDAKKFYETLDINAKYLKAGVFDEESYMCPYYGKEKYDVVFVGSTNYHREWPYREELVDFLRNTYGERFHKFGNPETVVREHDLNKIYASTKVVVGDSLCVGFRYSEYWSDRLYETIGRGGFLIFPYIGGIEEEYKNKEEIVYYKYGDFKELKKLIDYYLDNKVERESIRKNGFNRTISSYTYKHRIKKIIEVVDLGNELAERTKMVRPTEDIYIKSLSTGEYVCIVSDVYPQSKQQVVATHRYIATPFTIKTLGDGVALIYKDKYLHSHYFKVKISEQFEVTMFEGLDDSSVWYLEFEGKSSLKGDIYVTDRVAIKNKHLKSYLHTHNIYHNSSHKQLTTWETPEPLFEWTLTNLRP